MNDLPSNTERMLLYIQQNPGCHLRQIKRDLGMSMGTVQYHLNLLEKSGKISSERQRLHRFYFPVSINETHDRNILKILNQETAREILMFIVEMKNPTQTEIVDKIKISAASVNWHIGRLAGLGIINETRDGKYKRYSLVGDSSYVVTLMKNYHPSIWDKWSNRLAETFLSLSKDGEQ
ncbi:MAG TPA: winged helix-turn-helix transcriptional regulator [Nitrosopumilaceae archaeon]|nr:winged helix-turn-helix transcriptional regulator [Nitrosopumilaceae archaeon]